MANVKNVIVNFFNRKKNNDTKKELINELNLDIINELGNLLTTNFILSKIRTVISRTELQQKDYAKIREIINIFNKYNDLKKDIPVEIKNICLYFKIINPELFNLYYTQTMGNFLEIYLKIADYYFQELDKYTQPNNNNKNINLEKTDLTTDININDVQKS